MTLMLENSVIFSLTKNIALVNAFPFLRVAAGEAAKAGKKTCGGCGGGKAAVAAGIDYTAIKNAVVGLSPEMREKFKTMLDADKVVIYSRQGGKLVATEF